MSYFEQTHCPRNRNTAIVGVVAIHALLGYAVVNGLTITDVFDKISNPQSVFIESIELPPIPPETDPAPAADSALTPPSPSPAIALPPMPGPTYVEFDPTALVLPEVSVTPDPGPSVLPPSPKAAFTPRGATPSNERASWIGNEDYPARALRDDVEGTVAYRLVVGSSGRVSACEITSSSGSRLLDEATCRLITRRARFDAATDETGARVIGTFAGTVTWQIPG